MSPAMIRLHIQTAYSLIFYKERDGNNDSDIIYIINIMTQDVRLNFFLHKIYALKRL